MTDTIHDIAAQIAALDRNAPDYDAKAIVLALQGMAIEARERHPNARFIVLVDSDQGPYAVWATTTDADGNELTEYEPDDNCWASALYDPARQAAAPYTKDGTTVGAKRAPWEGVEIDIDKVLASGTCDWCKEAGDLKNLGKERVCGTCRGLAAYHQILSAIPEE